MYPSATGSMPMMPKLSTQSRELSTLLSRPREQSLYQTCSGRNLSVITQQGIPDREGIINQEERKMFERSDLCSDRVYIVLVFVMVSCG